MIKILVVEDSKVSQKKIVDSLYELNYKDIDIASNGKEAIKSAKNKKYDLIIMDIYLDSQLDGIETSEKILEIFLGTKCKEPTFFKGVMNLHGFDFMYNHMLSFKNQL